MKHKTKPKRLRIGFVMDPKEKLSLPWDTSVSIMEEAYRRGHHIFYIEPKNIRCRSGTVLADCEIVNPSLQSGIRILERKTQDLSALDIMFIRKDPPFDLAYLYLTQLLELISETVWVINSPRGIQTANEKLYILEFPDWIPPTLVSNDPVRIERFQTDLASDLILKPLHQKGGRGIRFLPKNTAPNRDLLVRATARGTRWVMAQKFLKSVRARGDKRILLLNGAPIGQFQRLPKRDEFRSNLSLGGISAPAFLTARERKMIAEMRGKLLADGLYFVGLDVVDGRLIEINVTSPAGIPEIAKLKGPRLEPLVVDFLERGRRRS